MICVQLRLTLASRDTFVSSKIVVFLERDFERYHLAEKTTGQKWAKKYTVGPPRNVFDGR
jgi:hypothetical protein